MSEVNSVVDQFFFDKSISFNSDVENDMAVRAALIKKLCDTYRKDPEKGDIIIDADLTAQGGTIHFYTLEELKARSTEDECRNHFRAARSRSVLIEPTGYPTIEPYNRQSPYYLGLGYSRLSVALSTEHFVMYLQKGDYETGLFTSFDEYSYNNFWQSVTFGLAIKNEDISNFLTELGIIMRPFGYCESLINMLISFEKETR